LASVEEALRHKVVYGRQHRVKVLTVLLLLLSASVWMLASDFEHFYPVGLYFAFAAVLGIAGYKLVDYVKTVQSRRRLQSMSNLIGNDQSARIIIDGDTKIWLRNAAARDLGLVEDSLSKHLKLRFLDADDAVNRLIEVACFEGSASEQFVTRTANVQIYVHRIDKHLFSCEIRSQPHFDATAEGGLTLPMLTAAANGTVLFMNQSARDFLGVRKTSLSEIFEDDTSMSDINCVKTENGLRPCFLMENTLSGGRREIFLIPALGAKTGKAELSYESMPVAVMKIDETGTILSSNRTAREMIGPDAKEHMHLSDIMEGLGRPLSDWLAEAADGRAQNLNEFLRIKRNDRERFVQVTLGRTFENSNTALYAIFHDATELKKLEAQFVQSQKMQAIGQLAGGIAHDFNNLLTAISGHCDLLLLKHEQDDPVYSDLMQIHQNANRAASLVGQLLAFSRKQTLQPDTIDLREVLSDLTHLLSRLVSDDVDLSVNIADELSSVYLDPQQFEQVVMNLVVNARDAMPQGGAVTIHAQNLSLSEPEVRERATIPPGDYVQVLVIDEGTGISADTKEKVFEPFYTTKQTGEGTGLGLSTAYGIVKQSGGFIFLDSSVGEGTTFTLLFPTAEHKAPVFVRNPIKEGQSERIEGTVLLVEDEAPVRAFAARALRLKGLSVLEASCGEEALEILEDTTLTVDLFLSDVAMPGLDGPAWVKKALETRPDPRIVFMSGYAEEKFASDANALQNAVFLPKPFSLDELAATVQQQIVTA